jgi:hypothetical protein
MLQIADGYKTMAKHAEARAVKGRKARPTHYPTPGGISIEKNRPLTQPAADLVAIPLPPASSSPETTSAAHSLRQSSHAGAI